MLIYINPASNFPNLHSDKIFGAILSTMNDLFPSKIEEVIDDFNNGNPPFLISSAFPFIKIGDRKIRFYPKIIVNEKKFEVEDANAIKDFKNVKFFQEEIFFSILNNNLTINEILNNYDNFFQKGKLLLKEDLNIKDCFLNNTINHRSVNRLNNSFNIFQYEGVKYSDQSGLFFNIFFYNEEYKQIILSIFRLLKDRGFGKHVSIGHGQFTYEIEDIDIFDFDEYNANSNKDYFVTLSRFIPNDVDIKFIDRNSAYELGFKRGFSRLGTIRNQVRFFNEGSTFLNHGKYYGQLVNTGKNSVEYGFAFPLNFNKM